MESLSSHPLFDLRVGPQTADERVSLAYKRAQLICRSYNLSVEDILNYSPKFWDLHLDPIVALDFAAFTILAAHINLTVGTIAPFLPKRPDLEPLVHSLLRMDTVGVYLLSERGHGLDSFNNETIATWTKSGFVLHTPREEAAKFMPATTPAFGIPKVALVNAKLIVDGTDRGSRWFIVPVCTETRMHPGVTSVRLPRRSGTTPLDFSMTFFDHVQLPPTAMLGASLEAPRDPRASWWREVWRIPLGSMAVAGPCVSTLKHVAYIGGRYSCLRHVTGHGPTPIPIISFPSQQWAILEAVAAGTVLGIWYRDVTRLMADGAIDGHVKHGLSVLVKTVCCRYAISCTQQVAERCGAQGTFETNMMTKTEADMRGAVIAEGDIVALCIRLYSELLLGRYSLPLPSASSSVLAKYAHFTLSEDRAQLATLKGGHRSDDAAYHMLPIAERAIMALGHSCAYESASRAGVSPALLDLYVCSVARRDPAWFSEQGGVSRAQQRKNETAAMRAALPDLQQHLDALGVAKHVRASILTDDLWKQTVQRLPTYRGSPPATPLEGTWDPREDVAKL